MRDSNATGAGIVPKAARDFSRAAAVRSATAEARAAIKGLRDAVPEPKTAIRNAVRH